MEWDYSGRMGMDGKQENKQENKVSKKGKREK